MEAEMKAEDYQKFDAQIRKDERRKNQKMAEQKEIKEFKEIYPQKPAKDFEGDFIDIEKIFGKEIVVYDFYEVPEERGKYGSYLIVQIEVNGEKHKLSTGSTVLVAQIKTAEKDKNLPFKGIIEKIENKEKKYSYHKFKN